VREIGEMTSRLHRLIQTVFIAGLEANDAQAEPANILEELSALADSAKAASAKLAQ
jgi:hypothetical protein